VSVREPHNVIQQLLTKQPNFQTSETVKKAQELYTQLKTSLRSFETEKFNSWQLQSDSTITESLGKPLLGEKLTLGIQELKERK